MRRVCTASLVWIFGLPAIGVANPGGPKEADDGLTPEVGEVGEIALLGKRPPRGQGRFRLWRRINRKPSPMIPPNGASGTSRQLRGLSSRPAAETALSDF